MATRTVYLIVRMNIEKPNAEEILDEDIDFIVSEMDYQFNAPDGFRIDTEISEFTSDNYPF